MSFRDDPIINSPFEKPRFHYELDKDEQPTGAKLEGRRVSKQVVPVPPPDAGGRGSASWSCSRTRSLRTSSSTKSAVTSTSGASFLPRNGA
jgi:hypothetical protein